MEILNPGVRTKVRYKDFYIRLTASIIGAHIITVFGEKKSTFELLLMKEYYIGFVVSFFIAFLLINYIHWVTSRLDKKYSWEETPLTRLLLQLLLAFIAPAILDFFQAAIYMRVYGVNILNTAFVTHDFQFILMMLLLLNIYYIGFYFFLRWQQAEQYVVGMSNPESPKAQGKFLVSQGNRNIPVFFDEICYFYRDEDANYLKTFSEERYFLSYTLDDIAVQLDQNFFRANRQMIINKSSLVSYKSIDNKIELELEPPFNEQVYISSKRAKGFRDWIKKHS